MKRVIIFVNGTDVNGKVFMVTHSVGELLMAAGLKFEMTARRLFTPQGGEIDDIKLIRDDDILYVSSGEDFVHKSKSIEVNNAERDSDWITLNVGGKCFITTRSTLTNKEPMSMLARMFTWSEDSEWKIQPSKQDHTGAFLIDRSPMYFEPLLNYLRHGQLILDTNLNAAGEYANLRGCRLVGANLSKCCLERADLSCANLEGAQLICVKMLCANLEAANLRSCNFQDPLGLPAIMEGVNLKGANLEGSNMSSVNLRVATLKNAILKNCDLRSAVLAGADLECCDLSGSDLHEANLRGANLKDTTFELMLTPLHMSQTVR
ncbi:BTB/POZ domain-containing protein KCTD9 isoform X3 [Cephus cinctus]|uniref:BTB/POZ domain-containing protein KCTD9 isoform X3 n=1 Tax=Cephus cinctus TaxID=211228 RepID=A0AAJ7VWX0_CEPCN|nr:BTB/POZ domain-containing protein KCTD9 isoform X3 [Cephus cinctus]